MGCVDPVLGGTEAELPDELLEPLLLLTCELASVVSEFVASFELLALEVEPSQPTSVPTNAHHPASKSVLCKDIVACVY